MRALSRYFLRRDRYNQQHLDAFYPMFMPAHQILDCHRLLCPMPVIRVQDKVAHMRPGDELEAVCTDPGVMNDIPAWCRINGHEVLEVRERDDEYIVVIRVGESD